MASASLYLQTPGAHFHSCSSSSSKKVIGSRHPNLVFANSRTRSWNAFRGPHIAFSTRIASTVLDLHQGRSYSVVQAQQPSNMAHLADQTVVAGNTEGNPTGKEQEIVSNTEDNEDIELEKGYKMNMVCDRLIEVFMSEKPNSSDWRKLLALSKEWSMIRPYFYKRCRVQADAEDDPEKKRQLLRLSRKVKEVDEDMQRHDGLLKEIREKPLELDAIVARRRKDFTGDFFQHLKNLCNTFDNNLEARDELASVGTKCLATIEAYDKAIEAYSPLSEAHVKFNDIINSPSLEAASKKIDNLAKQNQLDSAFMLTVSKAWAFAKDTPLVKDEVKDMMYHLYLVARGNLQRQLPKEIRIMKHIITIKDPEERFTALTQAFTPGDEMEGEDFDILCTTPKDLHKWIQKVLDAYYMNKQNTLIQEARKLMKPMVIQRLEVLKKIVEEHFM